MTSIHGTVVVFQPDPVVFTSVLLGVLLLLHLLRAKSVSGSAALRWCQIRGLSSTPRLVRQVELHLRRVHLARTVGTAVLGLAAMLLVIFSQPSISFFSMPLLVGVFLAELLAPEPRQGRVRRGALDRRSSGYFAPGGALLLTRALLALGLAASGFALVIPVATPPGFFLHAAVLALGWCLFEAALRQLTIRGLPSAAEDLAVDCALRVSDARSLTAAGLVFACLGLVIASIPVVRSGGALVSALWSIVVPLGVPGALFWALALMQPQRSWRPA